MATLDEESVFLTTKSYVPNPVLVIIDVQPKELGIPTKSYYAIEEVKEAVSGWLVSCEDSSADVFFLGCSAVVQSFSRVFGRRCAPTNIRIYALVILFGCLAEVQAVYGCLA
ncbi:26S proteasome non-ATPase regulatory subunit 7 [Artemisia annua]|uniref:26S proteasome non-ATPase regulatory subunit 7 n=1 Tax=Artemisia annua TaxID=35608 RepID=A0A2U1MYV2_ARTAN|nr:26S proteasome non-ATPase regulatory subunit 7 [Artemisia annua]